ACVPDAARPLRVGLIVGLVALGTALGFRALAGGSSEPAREGEQFFEQQIKPILAENCFKCHSHAAHKSRGGLMVDGLGGLLQGGDRGPAIVPGEPDKSLLIRAVRYNDLDLKMPPNGKMLSKEQVTLLTRWVKMGAPAPAATAKAKKTPGTFTSED